MRSVGQAGFLFWTPELGAGKAGLRSAAFYRSSAGGTADFFKEKGRSWESSCLHRKKNHRARGSGVPNRPISSPEGQEWRFIGYLPILVIILSALQSNIGCPHSHLAMAQWPARRQGFPLLSEGGAAGEAGPSLLLSMDITVLSLRLSLSSSERWNNPLFRAGRT